MTAELVKKLLIPKLISGNLAIWTVRASEKVVLYCFWVPREINLRLCSKIQWQMFLLVSGRHVGAHPDEHLHGVSIQSSVNLGNTLLRMAREWKIAETWFLARLFILQLSITSQILELIYWTITIFSFDHITDENQNISIGDLKILSLLFLPVIHAVRLINHWFCREEIYVIVNNR